MSKIERTGWRDKEISERHRLWGNDCPAVDIDFLLLEYDRALPVALVEYKMELSNESNWNHPSYKAMRILANNSKIPFFVSRYKKDFSLFTPKPMNDFAHKWLISESPMSEIEWVTLLYKIRGRAVPSNVSVFLNSAKESNHVSESINHYDMHIEVRLTGDYELDEKRKIAAMRLLSSRRGADTCKFRFKHPDGKLDFSSTINTNYDIEIVDELAKLYQNNAYISIRKPTYSQA